MIFLPQIISNTNGNEHSSDLISLDLVKNRVIYLSGEINTECAISTISQIRYLSSKSNSDIYIVINSPGGCVSDGLAIYDAMNESPCDVNTIGTGVAASMGAFLLSSGTKGKRYITPSTEVMIHQPLGGVQGQATDISLVAEHIQKMKAKIINIMAQNCNKKPKTITNDMERDFWMSSDQSKAYGLVDIVGYPEI